MPTTALNPLLISIDVTQVGGAVSATLTRPLRVVDVSAYVTTAAAVATSVTVAGYSADISNAISLGNNTLGQVGRAGTIDNAYSDVASGSLVQATQGGSGTASRVNISCIDVS